MKKNKTVISPLDIENALTGILGLGKTAHPGMNPEDENPPFTYIREGLWDLYNPRRLVDDHDAFPRAIAKMIDAAENCYRRGEGAEALLWVWDAGRVWVVWAEATTAKRLRKNRKSPTASGKANVEAAWKRAFNTHNPFRRWDASGQADYLAANYNRDVAGIKRESLAKYIRAFRKKAQ